MFLRKIMPHVCGSHIKTVASAGRRRIYLHKSDWNKPSKQKIVFSASDLNLKNSTLQRYLEFLQQEYYNLRVNMTTFNTYADNLRMQHLGEVVGKFEQYRALEGNIVKQEDLKSEKDEDLRQLIEEENEVYTGLLQSTEQELMTNLIKSMGNEYYPSMVFEVKSGVGGQEAMLFAKELFNMYVNYFDAKDWAYDILAHDTTDIGGLRHADVLISNPEAYNCIRYEAGVHRVQRVPATEKSGRIHTSTASIMVIPQPANVSVNIDEKDLKIETKRASGAGGQHVNTTDSAVRIVHLPTGIAIESKTERSQFKNRELALNRLKVKLMRQQLDENAAQTRAKRQEQQGTQNRNEKIRTYNFLQDRITDHRIENGTVYNIPGFLDGGENLDILMDRVRCSKQKETLIQTVANWVDADTTYALKNKQK